MDCNLKKLANFSKFFLCILEKSLNTDYSIFFLRENPYYFLPGVVSAISYYKPSSLSNIGAVLKKNTAKIAIIVLL